MTAIEAPPRRCLLVANPAAGQVAADVLRVAEEQCGAAVAEVAVARTDRVGHATRIVADALALPENERPDVIVALGGDGTVREVAEGFAGADPVRRGATSLLIVPAGTGNSCHRAIWGDRPWQEVIPAVLGGEPTRIRFLDLLRVVGEDRIVLLGASAGFIAEVTAEARTLRDTVDGRQRYHEALGRVWLRGPSDYPGRVLLDGAVLHEGMTTMVTLGGARHRVGTFEVLPRSVLDDGLLDVCAVDGGLTDQARQDAAVRIMSGTHVGTPGITYAQGRSVTIERTDGHPLCFEHDGEVWTREDTTLTLEIMPGVLPVLSPREPVAG
ncbi:hypothetical protein F0L68_38265 [Solihabitans fulvus]|uniref:DAGKc domain-containing protein n=1 Tax=Solihabitans fulvus TaxID=1892852 RepID=A0A5B2WFG0_9PSEU|nr:diacylglycerol kinase family protein [Solihabitans fulvus]KAA2250943.1 hypothetical protein F0L68_38265 [Solihabitans fulvus]